MQDFYHQQYHAALVERPMSGLCKTRGCTLMQHKQVYMIPVIQGRLMPSFITLYISLGPEYSIV